MLLKDAFEKDIDRPIDPVVKADETDDAHLANELDEFVVTNEVKTHLLKFLESYNELASVGNGAWISGFFGSGKSHLLKILAVALENRNVQDEDGTVKPAMDYLIPKVSDIPALVSAMEMAPKKHPSESILFNIDAYAPNSERAEAGAMLSAFIKAFNHHCGYFDGEAHIAKLEYDLDKAGKLDAFREAIARRLPGQTWEVVRTYTLIYSQQISAAFDEAVGNPEGYSTDIVKSYQESYKPDIRMFAQRVADYIKSKNQKGFRVNFFVDEVGQFIAQNTTLMVNLQTIAEELGRVCGGDSWVIVTSQEDMDTIVGGMKMESANDFSKIQARFHIKMPLTSSDAKEVIQDRLLAKKPEDMPEFEALYEKYKDDFGVLFDFADGAKVYKCYQNAEEFCKTYPFVPYQFVVFESAMRGLSDHNCFTGKHNSTGARSMLGVFQMVAERICAEGANTEEGTLAAFDYMFEGLRNDLRGEVYADISTAEDQLDDKTAVRLLKALLLVKYVDDFRATPANLRVLLYGSFKENTSELNQKIQNALDELERQVYVRRNGNIYEYLTNDEKEVEQEINNLVVPEKDVHDEIAQLFQEVCGTRKITYKSEGGSFEHSYGYNLRIDGELQGPQRNDLTLDLVTDFESDGLLKEIVGTPKTLKVVLHGARDFLHNVGIFVKTDRYVRVNSGSSKVRQAIIVDKQTANQNLFLRLKKDLPELLTHATYNAGGTDVTAQVTGSGKDAVNSALLELIRRSYTGLQQITRSYTDNDVYAQCINSQMGLDAGLEDYCQSVLARIRFAQDTVTIGGDGIGSLTAWFSKNEFGWPEVAVRSAVAKLYAQNKVEVKKAGQPLEGAKLAEALKRKQDLDKLTVTVIEEVTPEQLNALQQAFRAFTGTNPKMLDPKSMAAELSVDAKRTVDAATAVSLKAQSYPFAERFASELKTVRECAERAGDRTWFICSFPEKADGLRLAKDDLSKMTAFCNGSPMEKRWLELKSFMDNDLSLVDELDIDRTGIDVVRATVEDPGCYRNGTIPGAYKAMNAVSKRAQEATDELRRQAQERLADSKASYEQTYKVDELPEHVREEFETIFQNAGSELSELKAPHSIRSFVDMFTDREAGRLIALLNPPAPEPQAKPDEPKGSSGEDIPPEVVVPPSPVARTVSVKKLTTAGFGKPVIESAQDADEYLAALKAAILDALGKGEKVTV